MSYTAANLRRKMPYEITDRTAFPNSAIVYVEVQYRDGFRARGSGTIVGVNDVLTAMHVVYQPDHGGWATGIFVSPGADTSPLQKPYGTFTDWGQIDSRTTNWDSNGDRMLYDSEAQWDIAVIGMRSPIGYTTGWLGLESQPSDFTGTMVGYPKSGAGMMAESVYADASASYGVYDIDGDLGPGASGGPLLYESGGSTYVAGVLSSGNGIESTYAGLFGTGTWDWLIGVIAANDDLIAGTPSAAITGSPAADTLFGDALANTIAALDGNDWIKGGFGNDIIDGGNGIDIAVFTGARSSYIVSIGPMTVAVTDTAAGRDGTDSLANVERLAFSDLGLALDLDGNAGVAAKTLGAVFGSPFVNNRSVVGIALQLTDGSTDDGSLMQLALQVKLRANPSNEDVVKLLVTNLTGFAPSASVLSSLTELLDSGALTQVSLGLMAANHALNTANIDLVGLASTGLEFWPAG
jgi:V8-like Glu-specific endopeptidase